MAATWTDLDRPTMKDALDFGYLTALRDNATWLKERFDVGHNGGKHGSSIDGSTKPRAYPAVLCFATRTAAGPPPSYSYSGTNVASIVGASAGVVTVNFSVNFSGGVNDFCVLAQPVTSPNTGDPLVSWNVSVRHVSTTSCQLVFVRHSAAAGTPSLESPEAFVLFVWGKYTDTATPWSSWNHIPAPLDGPVPTEWWTGLLTNLGELRSQFDSSHSLIDGAHRHTSVPIGLGVATYKTSIDSGDDRLWIVEPWSSGIAEGTVEKLDSSFDSGGVATVSRLLSMKLGAGYASRIAYGTVCAMNPYQVGATRARLAHPMQYRDAVIFAPRYYDGAAWSWAEQDENRTGAPDTIALMRFGAPFYVATPDAASRLCGIGSGSAADGQMVGVALVGLIRDELVELRRLFETQHSASDGTHDVSPPGIIGVGSVSYSAGYTAASWSRGFTVGTIAGSPVGCRVTFSSAFGSFRNWGAIAVGHAASTPTANDYRAIQCVRVSANQCDVYQWAGSTPAALHNGFDIVIFGVN